MGVSRYSRDPHRRRWEETFDALQWRCGVPYQSPTIGELVDHGIERARWSCRNKATCWHHGEPFELARFGRTAVVQKLRWHFVCDQCGTKGPHLELIAGRGPDALDALLAQIAKTRRA